MRLPKLFVGPFREIRRPAFEVDDKLVERQIAEARLHPVNGIKPLLEDQPETMPPHITNPPTVDFESLPV